MTEVSYEDFNEHTFAPERNLDNHVAHVGVYRQVQMA